ncbi:DnaK Molecular chaperone [Mycobacteriaceae bacterium]
MAVGFDFGTTNSLISVIQRGRAINVMAADGLPFPSVVRYEGERTVVGREAKQSLDEAGLGVYGNTVRSPKFLLGDESVQVGGVERSPIDIVSDVVKYVKSQSMESSQAKVLDGVRQAVVTIPVTMTGARRSALRDAFRRADIGIVQFVHEPFAALYGYLRGQSDSGQSIRALNRRNVLVVDWGGGTLDLTLCRIESDRVVQLRNGGSDTVGGDRFDEAIRNEVILRFCASAGISADANIRPEAKLRLLQDAEGTKIALSERASASFYRPDFFSDPSATLEYSLTREVLDEITHPLVMSGMREIESLLDSVGIGPNQIAMCLVAGGMAAMPTIRGRLYEMFGPQRVEIPSDSATLIAQGAAWIAHDASRLQLAKPVELRLARGSYLSLIKAGTEMPAEREEKRHKVHLFCTDPTDGVAKFELCAPTHPVTSPQISDSRTPLGLLTVDVHEGAKLFNERLELEVVVDDDLILKARAWSALAQNEDSTVIQDLEFGLRLPGIVDDNDPDALPSGPSSDRTEGALTIRSNISDTADQSLIPGDVLYKFRPQAFEKSQIQGKATEEQVWEHLYYKPCAACRRLINDPDCRCATVPKPRAS